MKNLLILICLGPLFCLGQKTHTVAAKETLFSLGREFNIHPRELAEYNHIPFEKGLTIGQVIKIPAKGKMPLPVSTATPATPVTTVVVKEPVPVKATPVATVKPTTEMVSMPIYHKVTKKETLYHISTLYNKVPVADIKKWNKLTSDAVAEGTNLIVGYKKQPKSSVTTEVVKQTPTPVPVEIVKEAEPVKVAPKKTDPLNPVTGKNFNGGAFKNLYTATAKTDQSGKAGIFKSTSGWEDGKYYCLHNEAAAGTIVKITNTVTNKSVYAKVLDVLPDLKQNSGYILRLSNAAADELGAGAGDFDCTVQY
ncbi:MAG: hypothetical protein JWQ27_1897 [Ferruginibacter sp.]|nr:hypothetical protein [Ferruginibacter sp.]